MTEPKGELNMRKIKLRVFVYQRAVMFTNSKIAMNFD